jgi:hypothetical protein
MSHLTSAPSQGALTAYVFWLIVVNRRHKIDPISAQGQHIWMMNKYEARGPHGSSEMYILEDKLGEVGTLWNHWYWRNYFRGIVLRWDYKKVPTVGDTGASRGLQRRWFYKILLCYIHSKKQFTHFLAILRKRRECCEPGVHIIGIYSGDISEMPPSSHIFVLRHWARIAMSVNIYIYIYIYI